MAMSPSSPEPRPPPVAAAPPAGRPPVRAPGSEGITLAAGLADHCWRASYSFPDGSPVSRRGSVVAENTCNCWLSDVVQVGEALLCKKRGNRNLVRHRPLFPVGCGQNFS